MRHCGSLSDEQLSVGLAAGDDDAWTELYRRYARPLAAYGGRILRDPSAGDDVAQVSLISAYQALKRGSRPRSLRPWLYRIARNEALAVMERRRESPLHVEEGRNGEQADMRRALLGALEQLPERQRNVFLLREFRGLRMAEIGDELRLETQQVEQALFAARNRLAELLTESHGDCTTAQEVKGRALKAHRRVCDACRAGLGLVVGLKDTFLALLAGGGTPVAAKVGAAVVAAGIVASTPAVEPAKSAVQKLRPKTEPARVSAKPPAPRPRVVVAPRRKPRPVSKPEPAPPRATVPKNEPQPPAPQPEAPAPPAPEEAPVIVEEAIMEEPVEEEIAPAPEEEPAPAEETPPPPEEPPAAPAPTEEEPPPAE